MINEMMGRPGELVRSMTHHLRLTGTLSGNGGHRKFKSEAHRKAIELWEDNGLNFETLAPGWVDYMVAPPGSLKRALKLPPFDDAFPSPLLEKPILQH